MKTLLLRLFFCGTPEEYQEGKIIHADELQIYRKRWYYLLGVLLLAGPVIYLMATYRNWDVWLCVLLMIIGVTLSRDTVIEHYVVKLMRERKANFGASSPINPQKPR